MTQVSVVGCCSRTTRGRGSKDIELSEKKTDVPSQFFDVIVASVQAESKFHGTGHLLIAVEQNT